MSLGIQYFGRSLPVLASAICLMFFGVLFVMFVIALRFLFLFGIQHWNFYWTTFYPIVSRSFVVFRAARHIVCVKRDAKPKIYLNENISNDFSYLSYQFKFHVIEMTD